MRARFAIAVTGVVLGLLVNIATGTISVPPAWRPAFWLLTIVLGLVLAAAETRTHKSEVRTLLAPPNLEEVAGQLAAAVTVEWRREEHQRRVNDPLPLQVTWRVLEDESVFDHWANICGDEEPDAAPEPIPLAGRFRDILGVFRRVPSGRLVVLGRAGSGKTTLATRFLIDFAAGRGRRDPVPIIFGLAAWDPPVTSLPDWLARRLVLDHPALAYRGGTSTSLARRLIDAGMILPVLDGFDEIPPAGRRSALAALNRSGLPFVVTSRPVEYEQAVAGTDVLTGAAVIELVDLTLADLSGYLPRTAPKLPGRGAPATTWERLLARCRDEPAAPEIATVLSALSTPLMASLARQIYSESRHLDPVELLDADRFPSIQSVERHLLSAFLPAAYENPVSGGDPERRYDPCRAQRWLQFIAKELERGDAQDLAWWRLAAGARRRSRVLATGAVGLMTFGVVGGIRGGSQGWLFYGSAYGLAYGASAAYAQWASRDPTPTRVRLRLAGSVRPFLQRVTAGLLLGAGLGLIFGLPSGTSLVLGLVFGLIISAHMLLDTPLDARQVTNPLVVLRQDRTAALIFATALAVGYGVSSGLGLGLGFTSAAGTDLRAEFGVAGVVFSAIVGACSGGLVGGLAYGRPGILAYGGSGAISGLLVFGPAYHARSGWAVGLSFGVAFGVAAGLAGLLAGAWGRYSIVRLLLAARGELPWRLAHFIQDAHRRGILRQAGDVFQFRHARLQAYLAGQPYLTAGPRGLRRPVDDDGERLQRLHPPP